MRIWDEDSAKILKKGVVGGTVGPAMTKPLYLADMIIAVTALRYGTCIGYLEMI